MSARYFTHFFALSVGAMMFQTLTFLKIPCFRLRGSVRGNNLQLVTTPTSNGEFVDCFALGNTLKCYKNYKKKH